MRNIITTINAIANRIHRASERANVAGTVMLRGFVPPQSHLFAGSPLGSATREAGLTGIGGKRLWSGSLDTALSCAFARVQTYQRGRYQVRHPRFVVC